MKIYVIKKDYIKESKEVRNAIMNSMEVLFNRITEYEKQPDPDTETRLQIKFKHHRSHKYLR